MSLATVRGGIPHVWRATIDDTGRQHRFPFMCNWLTIRASGAAGSEPCKMYFTQADFDAGNDAYVLVPLSASDAPYGQWEGPAEVYEVYLQCATVGGTSDIELVAYQRRA